jgi:hypothetical protein
MLMADARQRAEWGRTAELLAMQYNTTPGLEPAEMKAPKDFFPFDIEPEQPPLEVPIQALKVFCDPSALARPGEREHNLQDEKQLF